MTYSGFPNEVSIFTHEQVLEEPGPLIGQLFVEAIRRPAVSPVLDRVYEELAVWSVAYIEEFLGFVMEDDLRLAVELRRQDKARFHQGLASECIGAFPPSAELFILLGIVPDILDRLEDRIETAASRETLQKHTKLGPGLLQDWIVAEQASRGLCLTRGDALRLLKVGFDRRKQP
jgi:hypothetical protein